jgi:hypothetical protein
MLSEVEVRNARTSSEIASLKLVEQRDLSPKLRSLDLASILKLNTHRAIQRSGRGILWKRGLVGTGYPGGGRAREKQLP